MADIITNLHPDGDESTNLYPNIKKENIPSKSISTDKLDDNVLSLIGSLKPSGTDTSTNILAFTYNKGIYVATDNGHWYYWNGSAYVDGGVYQAISVAENSINYFEIGNDFKQIKDDINAIKGMIYVIGGIYTSGFNAGQYDQGLTSRCTSIHPIYLKVGDAVRSYSGFSFRLARYDNLGNFIDSPYTNYKDEHIITDDGYYYIMGRKNDDSTITSSELTSISSNIVAIYANKNEIIKSDLISNIIFVEGNIGSSGEFIDSTLSLFNQITTPNFVKISKKCKVATKTPEFLVKISYYSYNGAFMNDTGWHREITIPKNSLVKITVRSVQKSSLFSNGRDYTKEEVVDQFAIIKINEYPNFEIKNSKKYMHISFDDFCTPFQDITTNAETYTSIFDNSFFSYLKRLHDIYGCVFSCYCYLTNETYDIENVTNKFTSEFKENSSWLKFGFHSRNTSINYANETSENATADYNKFITNIIRICGTYEAVDVIPRLHNFAGNTDSLIAMRDCECGIKGVLGADDTRQNYNLSSADGSYLFNHERFFDGSTQLHYITTDIRLERDDTDSVIASINNCEKTWANKCQPLIVFTHEWALNDSIKSELERCLDFGVKNGYDFDYPQNKEI